MSEVLGAVISNSFKLAEISSVFNFVSSSIFWDTKVVSTILSSLGESTFLPPILMIAAKVAEPTKTVAKIFFKLPLILFFILSVP